MFAVPSSASRFDLMFDRLRLAVPKDGTRLQFMC